MIYLDPFSRLKNLTPPTFPTQVSKQFQITTTNSSATCLLVISQPKFFENVIVPFCKTHFNQKENPKICKNIIEEATKNIFLPQIEKLEKFLQINSSKIKFHRDSDMKPNNSGPYFLCQVAGHVAKAAYYHQASDEIKGKFGLESSDNLMGVCLHNKFGGHFAFRGCYVIDVETKSHNTIESDQRDQSLNFDSKLLLPGGPDANDTKFDYPYLLDLCESEKLKKETNFRPNYNLQEIGDQAVYLLNKDWKDGKWRDLVGTERYSDECLQFFKCLPKDRMDLMFKFFENGIL